MSSVLGECTFELLEQESKTHVTFKKIPEKLCFLECKKYGKKGTIIEKLIMGNPCLGKCNKDLKKYQWRALNNLIKIYKSQ